jgi:hypothetical protein
MLVEVPSIKWLSSFDGKCLQQGPTLHENLQKKEAVSFLLWYIKIFSQFLKQVKYDFFKSFHILADMFEPCIEIWKVVLNFDQIMVTENFKNHITLSLLFFNTSFWLYVAINK